MKNRTIRSPLYYLGDKFKIFSQISKFFPKNINIFYDIFGGGGTMIANVSSIKTVYNDIDKNVTNLVKTLYKYSNNKLYKDVINVMKKHNLNNWKSVSKEEFKKNFINLRNEYNNKKIKSNYNSNIFLFVLVLHGFNSQIRYNSKKQFNIPVGKQTFNNSRKKHFFSFTNAITSKNIKFQSKDFGFLNKMLENNELNDDDFIYLDPPYLITNATYNNIWNEQKEIKLLKLLDKLNQKKIKWALSNVMNSKERKNLILEKWSKLYNVHKIDSSYNNSNYQRKHRKKDDVEVLITNYEIGKIQ